MSRALNAPPSAFSSYVVLVIEKTEERKIDREREKTRGRLHRD